MKNLLISLLSILSFVPFAILADNNRSLLDEAYYIALEDKQKEPAYYNLFLNSELFIPVHSYSKDEAPNTGITFDPILIKTDGVLVLMLFDSLDRLRAWGNDDLAYVSMPGRQIVASVGSDINWALNVGTDHMKIFVPEELQWLEDLVSASKVENHLLPKGTQVFIDSPENASQDLILSINNTLYEFPEVNFAFLASISYGSASGKSHLILAIDANNLTGATKGQINNAIRQSIIGLVAGSKYLDITYISNEGIGKKISESLAPTYTADNALDTVN